LADVLYSNDLGGPQAWSTCTGNDTLGQARLGYYDAVTGVLKPMPTTDANTNNLWGLHYNRVTGKIYATARHGGKAGKDPGQKHLVWVFTPAEMAAAMAPGGPDYTAFPDDETVWYASDRRQIHTE
jgi:hypothetical protein